MKRRLRLVDLVLVLVLVFVMVMANGLVGCTSAPIQLYAGERQPPDSVATVVGTKKAQVHAIDSVPTFGKRWSLLPGPHRVWVRAVVVSTAPTPHWTIWTYCQLEFSAVAGESYSTELHTQKKLGQGTSETLSMQMSIADSGGVSRGEVLECTAQQPRFEERRRSGSPLDREV